MKEQTKSDKTASEQFGDLKLPTIPTNKEYNQDLKKRLEQDNDFTIIKFNEVLSDANLFKEWLSSIARYGNVNSVFLIKKHKNGGEYSCLFFTNEYQYTIRVRVPIDMGNDLGYVGCGVSTRKTRVGETWSRGMDLPDGKYTKDTFSKIEKSIIRYELKNLQLWR